MPIGYEALMALTMPEVTQRYDERDTILYALSIGIGGDPLDERQLRFVYEPGLLAVPTQALVLALLTTWLRDSGLDYTRIVHGEQSATFYAPLPAEGAVTASLRIADVIDKGEGKGALVYIDRDLRDADSGAPLATLRQTIFARGDGGIGGPGNAQPPVHTLPDRQADGTVALATLPQQALLYRLNGDRNPLHADPKTAIRAGFDRPILHGLATFGIATHALLGAVCGYDPARLVSIGGRFTAPVFPGETLATDYWVDTDLISFRTRVVGRDVTVLGNGRATLR